jgi:hypothetical protein
LGHRAAHDDAAPPQAVTRFAALRGPCMSKLLGCEVLIVEDEPLIALELAESFRKVGADVTTASTLKQAVTRRGIGSSAKGR